MPNISLRALGGLLLLPLEFLQDTGRAWRWSKASPLSSRQARYHYDIILLAHTIEKGLSVPNPRPRFGKDAIIKLAGLMESSTLRPGELAHEMTYGSLAAYVELHAKLGESLGEVGPAISRVLKRCEAAGLNRRGGTNFIAGDASSPNDYHLEFLASRCSVRYYEPRKVPLDEIRRAVEVAQRAPSQCNRQGVKAFFYQDGDAIQRLLSLQGGSGSFKTHVHNLFVIASDITAWSGANARMQAHVDASLFGQQLSLACKALGLGTCMLNLATSNRKERRVRSAAGISNRYRLIFMMAVGFPAEGGQRIPRSERVAVEDVLEIK